MMYYFYLKRKDEYFTLIKKTYDHELEAGMVTSFEDHELSAYGREYPELIGMSSICLITNIYNCDGMRGVVLSEIT